MPDRDRADFRPARESSLWALVILVVLLLGAGAVWWRWTHMPAPVETAAPAAPPSDSAPAEAPAVTGPQFPIDSAADAALPKLADSDAQIKSALTELLGNKSVLSFLQVNGFVRRVVATVDNLPRDHAASRMWPVQPAPKRFAIEGSGAAQTIGRDNGARYTPFVLFVESVNTQRAAALYVKFYPLFQQAYEELGYPNRYFNDRLVAVIDHLLQAPEPSAPPQVKLTEVKGDVPSERPWVRYEFVDPQLQSLSAGQKMLVRAGPVNERRLKAKLAEFRRQVVKK